MLFHNWKQKTFIAVILICFCYLPPFSVFHSLTVLIPHKLFEACSPKSLERFNVFFTFKIESILRIELKTKLFKFYAIQYDHTGLLRCVFSLSNLVLHSVRQKLNESVENLARAT